MIVYGDKVGGVSGVIVVFEFRVIIDYYSGVLFFLEWVGG